MGGRVDGIGFARRAFATRNHRRAVPRPGARWAALAAGVLCLVVAHRLAWAGGPHVVLLGTCVLATASILGATISLFAWAGADTTLVFRSRSLAMVTGAMALVAGCAIVRLATSSPFARLLATGRFGRNDIVDLGCLSVAIIALVGLILGVIESGSAYRRERRWPEELTNA